MQSSENHSRYSASDQLRSSIIALRTYELGNVLGSTILNIISSFPFGVYLIFNKDVKTVLKSLFLRNTSQSLVITYYLEHLVQLLVKFHR